MNSSVAGSGKTYGSRLGKVPSDPLAGRSDGDREPYDIGRSYEGERHEAGSGSRSTCANAAALGESAMIAMPAISPIRGQYSASRGLRIMVRFDSEQRLAGTCAGGNGFGAVGGGGVV
jgi:hypothetical protein